MPSASTLTVRWAPGRVATRPPHIARLVARMFSARRRLMPYQVRSVLRSVAATVKMQT